MTTPQSSGATKHWHDVAACGFILLYFVVWFAPGVLGGQILFVEDTASYFFANRSVLYALAHGGEFSWWDPLPGLGLPRLANLQSGYLSPFSALFYLLPTARVFAFYPALVLSVLGLFCFGLFRVKGLGVLPALFGALSFSSLGNVTAHTQHLPFIETLVWLPGTLLAWELHCRSDRGVWAVLAGVGVAFQCLGAPQFVLYNALVMAVWMGLDLWDLRRDRRLLLARLAAGAGIAVLGIALASWQLLPSLELAGDSHRNLLASPEQFAGFARAAPREVLLALASESFWLFEGPPILVYGAPYPNLPNASLVTLGFAVFAGFAARRQRLEWLAVAVFLLGMLGAAGGVTSVLGWLVPFADRIRAPIRMIVPAGFLLSWLAACGMHRWLGAGAPRLRRLASALAVGWLAVLGYSLQWHDDPYRGPDAFEVPEVVAAARPRMAVDVRGSQQLPLFAVNAGLAAQVPSLLTRAALRPRNYFEALFASQHGSLDQARKLTRSVSATVFGFTDPTLPLIRSFGLETLVRYRDGEYQGVPMEGAVPRFYLASRVNFLPDRRERWAAAADSRWDPLVTVLSARPISRAALPSADDVPSDRPYGRIRVLEDEADHQSLEIESKGGVLVTSELFYPGWEARIDGDPAPVLELNLALRGVLLPPGSHRVDWIYRPTWLPAAWAASALAAIVALGLGLGLRRTLF
jgi:hypothetical protein